MDLFGITKMASIGGKCYAFVIVNDYSHFTWIIILSHKHETFRNFDVFYKKIQREVRYFITSIHSDHVGKFETLQRVLQQKWNVIKLLFAHISTTK